MDDKFSKSAAAEVKKLLRAMVVFIKRVTSGDTNTALSMVTIFLIDEKHFTVFVDIGLLYTCGVYLR